MAQPTAYDKGTNFRQYAESNPAAPYNPAALDSELNNVERTLDETLVNLALIQRDDGNLQNGIVSIESLSEAIISLIGSEGWNVVGVWASGTNYTKDDVVEFGTQTFVCVVSHISNSSFTVDRNAGRWIALTSVTDAASYLAAAQDAQAAAEAAQAGAATSETNAETAETNAETAATSASNSAASASTSETNAAASELAAATSETNAATSETNAAASAAAAAASYDSFDDRYLGAKAADPALDNDGNALIEGALYWNTVSKAFRVYNGSAFQDIGLLSSNGFSMVGAINLAKSVVAATATTTPLWDASYGNYQEWTGTPTITAFPNAPQAGSVRQVYPAAGTIFTAGANITILGWPSGSYKTASGDKVTIYAASTTTFVLEITRANGTPISRVGELFDWPYASTPPHGIVCDGSALSSSTYANLFSKSVKTATVTISIASPGVVSWVGHGLYANAPVKFTTTGALPTGITAGTTYYVISAGLTTDTFRISATIGGAAINTSGSQSGAHTAIHAPHGCANDLSTFNVPNIPADYTTIQASANEGVVSVGEVIAHNHTYSYWNAGLTGLGYGEGGSDSNYQVLNTGTRGGTANRAAGMPVRKCIIF